MGEEWEEEWEEECEEEWVGGCWADDKCSSMTLLLTFDDVDGDNLLLWLILL